MSDELNDLIVVEAPVIDAAPEAQAYAIEVSSDAHGADALDTALVDQAVQQLNQIAHVKGLQTALAVAECLIALFFDGRPDLFYARGKSHLSFQALKKRTDLAISYQFMWNACAVYDQLRRLPPAIGEALPLAHHKLLLPVKDEQKKRELATQAVAQGMSKERFAQEVARAKQEQGKSAGGRPPLPAFAKGFAKLAAVVAQVESEAVTAERVAAYGAEDTAALLAEVDGMIERLRVVAERVRAGGVG